MSEKRFKKRCTHKSIYKKNPQKNILIFSDVIKFMKHKIINNFRR